MISGKGYEVFAHDGRDRQWRPVEFFAMLPVQDARGQFGMGLAMFCIVDEQLVNVTGRIRRIEP